MQIKLKGITRHGKNRIREHGAFWEEVAPTVRPLPSRKLLRSLQTGDVRWLTDDFEIVKEN